MTTARWTSVSLTLAAAIQFTAGCIPAPAPAPPPTTAPPTPASAHGHEHPHSGHGAGPHEGTLADWGGGKYHVEFTVDHDKKEATVYVLGGDEKTPAPIAAKDGKLLLTITDPSFQVELMASPLEGETEAAASRYVGQHENLGIVREFAGSISSEVEGTPYAGDFKEEPHGAHDKK